MARGKARLARLDIADARLLADAERALAEAPAGCAWLDDRTVDDLDLPLVFRAIDRTTTATGAQVLWRWIAAPAVRRDVVHARERKLAGLTDRGLRDDLGRLLSGGTTSDAPLLPRLLWDPPAPLPRATVPIAFACALVASAIAAIGWPALWLVVAVLGVVCVQIDDWARLGLAQQARAVEVLGQTLDAAAAAVGQLPPELVGAIERDLAVRAALRRRLAILNVKDPFDILEFLRAALLVRLFVTRSCLKIVAAERERLRRIVLWVGELDALTSIARLRARRRDARVPELVDGAVRLDARGVVHPAIDHAIGNDVALDTSGLLVTGSNMSGKSTLLRTLAINAVLAQSIHTTFGAWRAGMLRVRTVMRVADDVASGQSTYAVQVSAVGELVRAATEHPGQWLFALDEPFSGTNPAIRVPIVVAVLDYLARADLVVAATHDLDVATRLDDRFARAYFAELPSGEFDRTLRAGVAPTMNAVELLERAGYPPAILAAITRSREAQAAG